jgi:tetratricopeptide (TPR) repeat protein
LSKDTKNKLTWCNKAEALNAIQNYTKAIECCNKSLEIDPNYTLALHFKGLSLYYLGKYREAIECYDRILIFDPKLRIVLINKGNALDKLGKHKEAKKYYDEAKNIPT